jgi:hypothetical protein
MSRVPEFCPTATIDALLWTPNPEEFQTEVVSTLSFTSNPNGIPGDRHCCNTILSDVRAPTYTRKVDEVLNRQSVSFIDTAGAAHYSTLLGLDGEAYLEHRASKLRMSTNDLLMETARQLGTTDTELQKKPQRILDLFLAECLGANVLLGDFQGTDRIPSFRDVPPAYDFGPYNPQTGKFTGATVMTTAVNDPCIHPGKKIVQRYPAKYLQPDVAKNFAQDEEQHRGFVGMVAMAGEMRRGQEVVFVPFRGRVPREQLQHS